MGFQSQPEAAFPGARLERHWLIAFVSPSHSSPIHSPASRGAAPSSPPLPPGPSAQDSGHPSSYTHCPSVATSLGELCSLAPVTEGTLRAQCTPATVGVSRRLSCPQPLVRAAAPLTAGQAWAQQQAAPPLTRGTNGSAQQSAVLAAAGRLSGDGGPGTCGGECRRASHPSIRDCVLPTRRVRGSRAAVS